MKHKFTSMKTAVSTAFGAVLIALSAPAQAQGQLTWVLRRARRVVPPDGGCVRKSTGIKVSMTRKSSGEIYAQIKAEAANPKGDVWWGGTGNPHLQAAEEGLTDVL